MSANIISIIRQLAINAIRDGIFTIREYGLVFTLEKVANREYAIMTELNDSPLCVGHVYA